MLFETVMPPFLGGTVILPLHTFKTAHGSTGRVRLLLGRSCHSGVCRRRSDMLQVPAVRPKRSPKANFSIR